AARTQSDADRLDARLTDWISDRVTLAGRSADLRARIYRSIAYAIDDALAHASQHRKKTGYDYDVIEEDLALNLACLRSLIALAGSRGAQVVLYQAPERGDLPPLADPARQE